MYRETKASRIEHKFSDMTKQWMTTTINLLTSTLCLELQISDEDTFLDVFGYPPLVELTETDLGMALRRCDYFMVDFCTCLESFFPFRHKTLFLGSSPPPTCDLGAYLQIAFRGTLHDILGRFDTTLVRWAYRRRRRLFHNHPNPYRVLLEQCHSDRPKTCLLEMLCALLECTGRKRLPSPECIFSDILSYCGSEGAWIMEWFIHQGVRLVRMNWIDVLAFSDDTLDMPLLRFLQYHGCPIHSMTVASASAKGRLDFVRWWYEQGYPFCETAPAWAVLWGHVAIVEFILEKKLPIDRAWTLANARKCRVPSVFERIQSLIHA